MKYFLDLSIQITMKIRWKVKSSLFPSILAPDKKPTEISCIVYGRDVEFLRKYHKYELEASQIEPNQTCYFFFSRPVQAKDRVSHNYIECSTLYMLFPRSRLQISPRNRSDCSSRSRMSSSDCIIILNGLEDKYIRTSSRPYGPSEKKLSFYFLLHCGNVHQPNSMIYIFFFQDSTKKPSARSGDDDESSPPLPHCCFERGPRRSITQSVPKKAWKSLRCREILMIERYRTVLTHLRAICADSLTASGLDRGRIYIEISPSCSRAARAHVQTDKRIRVCKYAAKPRLQVNLRYSSSAGSGVGGAIGKSRSSQQTVVDIRSGLAHEAERGRRYAESHVLRVVALLYTYSHITLPAEVEGTRSLIYLPCLSLSLLHELRGLAREEVKRVYMNSYFPRMPSCSRRREEET
ncbi:unnamed protein product [Trichogramma brassicae]|uniref:Uncharacterized protein n=1 Tax=Trichogramma brassicae TaxID=86971 RepID=A0A6H5I878_9HYME|nr:unnamed protein product [Trichogramma brassicae]